MPFQELSHTGDLQYRVTGATKEELFQESIKALFSTITDLEKVESREKRTIETNGATLEELLIEFLRVALDLFNADGFVAEECVVEFVSEQARVEEPALRLTALLRGESFDLAKHPFRTEIKAVTYYGTEVKELKDGFEATFTLDL